MSIARPAPHCPRCGTLMVEAGTAPVELSGGAVAIVTRWRCPGPKCEETVVFDPPEPPRGVPR